MEFLQACRNAQMFISTRSVFFFFFTFLSHLMLLYLPIRVCVFYAFWLMLTTWECVCVCRTEVEGVMLGLHCRSWVPSGWKSVPSWCVTLMYSPPLLSVNSVLLSSPSPFLPLSSLCWINFKKKPFCAFELAVWISLVTPSAEQTCLILISLCQSGGICDSCVERMRH